MRDTKERGEGREDGARTHSSHMSVVSGLWAEMDGGRKRSDERRVWFEFCQELREGSNAPLCVEW